MSLKKLLLATVGSTFLAVSVTAQEDVQVRTEALRGPLHVLYGQGGNIGISAGEDGIFIIDDQYAPLTDKIKAAIKEISDQPIRYVINTHFHGDHTGGNENLGKGGTVIVAHDNVRQRMSAGSFVKAFNMKTGPAPKVALPSVTFNDEMSLHLNGDEARIIHVENAHTDGDSIIHFRGSNLLHMGDLFFNGLFPFIDVSNGGSIDGVLSGIDKALLVADDQTIIIPGHGPVTDKAGLVNYRGMLQGTRDTVAAMKADGKSLDDVLAADPLAPYKDEFRGFNEEWPNMFVGFVYNSLK